MRRAALQLETAARGVGDEGARSPRSSHAPGAAAAAGVRSTQQQCCKMSALSTLRAPAGRPPRSPATGSPCDGGDGGAICCARLRERTARRRSSTEQPRHPHLLLNSSVHPLKLLVVFAPPLSLLSPSCACREGKHRYPTPMPSPHPHPSAPGLTRAGELKSGCVFCFNFKPSTLQSQVGNPQTLPLSRSSSAPGAPHGCQQRRPPPIRPTDPPDPARAKQPACLRCAVPHQHHPSPQPHQLTLTLASAAQEQDAGARCGGRGGRACRRRRRRAAARLPPRRGAWPRRLRHHPFWSVRTVLQRHKCQQLLPPASAAGARVLSCNAASVVCQRSRGQQRAGEPCATACYLSLARLSPAQHQLCRCTPKKSPCLPTHPSAPLVPYSESGHGQDPDGSHCHTRGESGGSGRRLHSAACP